MEANLKVRFLLQMTDLLDIPTRSLTLHFLQTKNQRTLTRGPYHLITDFRGPCEISVSTIVNVIF